jgi:hypothetical protein
MSLQESPSPRLTLALVVEPRDLHFAPIANVRPPRMANDTPCAQVFFHEVVRRCSTSIRILLQVPCGCWIKTRYRRAPSEGQAKAERRKQERKSGHALAGTSRKASCRPDHCPPCTAARNPGLLNMQKMRSFCIHCCGWGCLFRLVALQDCDLPPLDLVLPSFLFGRSNDAHEFVLSPTAMALASGKSPSCTTMLPSRSGRGSASMWRLSSSRPKRVVHVQSFGCGSCLHGLVQGELMEQ